MNPRVFQFSRISAYLWLVLSFACSGTVFINEPALEEAICGDGVLTEPEEVCDDGNTESGDGCSEDCTALEGGFTCTTPGEACAPNAACGNGTLETGEDCDDGNTDAEDGCNSSCSVEAGWICPEPGEWCLLEAACGNAFLEGAEACDDGNNEDGDGCAGDCAEVEPDYACPNPGELCVPANVCGNGLLEVGEACDDLNINDGDGCAGDCVEVEPDYACPNPGELCVPVNVCGNGLLEVGEACDDGDSFSLDGCSADCLRIEDGFVCPVAGESCVTEDTCGNGLLESGEACDDGDIDSGDGCTALCAIESGWACPVPGDDCVAANECGNGLLESGESCDDGNTRDHDGCPGDCSAIDGGYTCPVPGQACVLSNVCGNGALESGEGCDDGNAWVGDGCDADCVLEGGFVCPTPGEPCVLAEVCSNGIVDSGEACDDGNAWGGDGCAADCLNVETGYSCPTPGEACEQNCGNGDLDASEECDDGNRQSTDGCSAVCVIEAGYVCPTPGQLCVSGCGNGDLDLSWEECDDGDLDPLDGCDANCQVEDGWACPTPGSDCVESCGDGNQDAGEECDDGDGIDNNDCTNICRTARCGDGVLWNLGSGTEECDDGDGIDNNDCTNACEEAECGDGIPWDRGAGVEECDDGDRIDNNDCTNACEAPECGDGVLWNLGSGTEECDDGDGIDSNDCTNGCTDAECGDGITWYQGTGTEECDDGDLADDNDCTNACEEAECGDGIVWNGNEECDDGDNVDTDACTNACEEAECGDGIVWSGMEPCDDGNNGNDNDDCLMGCVAARCGDGVLWNQGSGTEECDDTNSNDQDDCTNACEHAECGDGIVWDQQSGSELCDDGVNNDSYGTCSPTCGLPSRYCGDGVVDFPEGEQCDDGTNDGSYNTCSSTCRLPLSYCGDGFTDVGNGEECDDGVNSGAYGTCSYGSDPNYCQLAARCGDGVLDPLYETCDDPPNDGSYGNCGGDCRPGPFCGDGVVSDGELCDDRGLCPDDTTVCTSDLTCGGAACTTRDGDGCTTSCTVESGWFCPVPGDPCLDACGNGGFDPGEQCDDGGECGDGGPCVIGGATCAVGTCAPVANDGCDASCAVEAGWTCPRFGDPCRELCGNGVLDSGEVCDDGGLCEDNTTGCTSDGDCVAAGQTTCTARSADGCPDDCSGPESGWECPVVGAPCNLYCGNGALNVSEGEVCDNGVNLGNYNGCMPGCAALGARCGDSITNGPEQCDGQAGCRIDCTWGVHCGDGVVIPPEECEDGGLCTHDDVTVCSDDAVCGAADITSLCTGRGVPVDGCDANCNVVSGYVCRVAGQPCESLATCGNGVIDGSGATGEQCDDGGLCSGTTTPCTSDEFCDLDDGIDNDSSFCVPQSGDGCDDTCSVVAPGWYCPNVGEPCTSLACGDGFRAGFEECDDGGTADGDGCDSTCKLESTTCGNGILEGDEQCDDYGASTPGCDASCMLEAGYTCPSTPYVECGADGSDPACQCTSTGATCGNGIHEGGEECDDARHCDDAARTRCTGDAQCESLLAVCDGTGRCGDINDTACVDDSDCQALPASDYPCVARAGDGCGPTCFSEPLFECFPQGGGTYCRPICGDGRTLVAVGEECDDGNISSGDGCSSACRIEAGFSCTDFSGLPSSIDIPMTFRDFRALGDNDWDANGECDRNPGDGYSTDTGDGGADETELGGPWRPRYCGHYDFEHYGCPEETTGLVETALSPQGNPVFTGLRYGTGGCGYTNNRLQLTDSARFDQWYEDTPGVNIEVVRPITMALTEASTRTYVYDSANPNIAGGFFPLNHCDDDTMCQADSDCPTSNCLADGYGNTPGYDDCAAGNCHNFSFTSEFHTYFQYNGGETLMFSGDDDVWVFINGILAVDLGGLHPPRDGSVSLSNAIDNGLKIRTDSRFGIYENGIYEIAFFHAERHTSGSNFQLTLSGFLRLDQSACDGICGDGEVRGLEECDGGNGGLTCLDLGYDSGTLSCNATTCVWEGCSRSNCPNGAINAGEECDDGNTVNNDACTNACQDASCGDTITRTDLNPGDAGYEECDDGNTDDTDYCTSACDVAECGDGYVYAGVEDCDDGALNGVYSVAGNCGAGCTGLGPRCGDGIENGGEVCDDGINDGTYGTCMPGCAELAGTCGDGTVDAPYEQCDGGARCNGDCTLNAICGDGVIDAFLGEQCDLGAGNSDDTYGVGTCTTGCLNGPFCGDSIRQVAQELCDDGDNTGAYGGCLSCTALGPYCGDGVQTTPQEECDLGTDCSGGAGTCNDGFYDGCNPDCTDAATCGDAVRDLGYEECDEGTSNSDSWYGDGSCNTSCENGPYCGDAIVNGSEVCDDGTNSGSYGSCAVDCSSAMPRCGDGVENHASEECDLGTDCGGDSSSCNDGAYDGCRANCTLAPYCGDGNVSFLFGGEECDGASFGGRSCTDLNGDGIPGDVSDGGHTFHSGTLSCNMPGATDECRVDDSGCLWCGDLVKNGTEGCDGEGYCADANVDCGTPELTCADFGFQDLSGQGLACSDCVLDLSGCNTSTCGNGQLDAGEVCDGAELGIRTCTDLDGDGQPDNGLYHGGALTCTPDCTLNTSACEYCGDGTAQLVSTPPDYEMCDGSDLDGRTCTDLDGDGQLDSPPVYMGGTLACEPTCDGIDESGCHECYDCLDCMSQGLACMDYACGPCIEHSDCCAGYYCDNGNCIEEES